MTHEARNSNTQIAFTPKAHKIIIRIKPDTRQHLNGSIVTDRRLPQTFTQTPKKEKESRLPFVLWPVSPLSRDRQRGPAGPRLLSRPANPLRHFSPKRAGPPHNRRCRVSRPCLLWFGHSPSTQPHSPFSSRLNSSVLQPLSPLSTRLFLSVLQPLHSGIQPLEPEEKRLVRL